MAESDDGWGTISLLAIGAVSFFLFSNNSWSNSLWYATQYGVGFDNVKTDDKPTDCDFMHSPLGSKDCTWKAHVKVYNTNGELVAGEGAPKYGRDTNTGKPILSYDGGKNWDWYIGTNAPDPKPKTVRVYWVKE